MRGGTSQDGEGAGGTLTRDQGARCPSSMFLPTRKLAEATAGLSALR